MWHHLSPILQSTTHHLTIHKETLIQVEATMLLLVNTLLPKVIILHLQVTQELLNTSKLPKITLLKALVTL
jgi:hypothetical protein